MGCESITGYPAWKLYKLFAFLCKIACEASVSMEFSFLHYKADLCIFGRVRNGTFFLSLPISCMSKTTDIGFLAQKTPRKRLLHRLFAKRMQETTVKRVRTFLKGFLTLGFLLGHSVDGLLTFSHAQENLRKALVVIDQRALSLFKPLYTYKSLFIYIFFKIKRMSIKIAGIEPGPSDHQAVILTTRQPTTHCQKLEFFGYSTYPNPQHKC